MVGFFSLCDFDFSYIRGCRAFLLCVQTSVSNPGSFHQFCVAALFSSSDPRQVPYTCHTLSLGWDEARPASLARSVVMHGLPSLAFLNLFFVYY